MSAPKSLYTAAPSRFLSREECEPARFRNVNVINTGRKA